MTSFKMIQQLGGGRNSCGVTVGCWYDTIHMHLNNRNRLFVKRFLLTVRYASIDITIWEGNTGQKQISNYWNSNGGTLDSESLRSAGALCSIHIRHTRGDYLLFRMKVESSAWSQDVFETGIVATHSYLIWSYNVSWSSVRENFMDVCAYSISADVYL